MKGSCRIVCIIAGMQAGGAERVMAQLCNYFAEQRYNITLLTLSASPDTSFYDLSHLVKRESVAQPTTWSRFGRITRVGARIAGLREKIISLHPDVIISFVDLTNIMVLLATIGIKLPVIISERVDPAAHAYRLSPLDRILRRLAYPHADRIVVQTYRAAKFFQDYPSSKIVTIPNPVPAPSSSVWPNRSSHEGRFRVIGVGRLDRQKGFDVLIDSFALLASRFPNWDVVIFGQGPEQTALSRQIEACSLTDRIQLTGVTKDITTELSRSHIIAFPSRYEGFPNALAEAMAAGLPAVAFKDVSGVEDLVIPGETGFLVARSADPLEGSEQAFADGLEQLMTSAELRAKMGTKAQSRVNAFSPEVVFKKWDQLITETLREARS